MGLKGRRMTQDERETLALWDATVRDWWAISGAKNPTREMNIYVVTAYELEERGLIAPWLTGLGL